MTHTSEMRVGDRVCFVSPDFPDIVGKIGVVIRLSRNGGEWPAVLVQLDNDRRWVQGPGVLEPVAK
jgi:hypothetical protein